MAINILNSLASVSWLSHKSKHKNGARVNTYAIILKAKLIALYLAYYHLQLNSSQPWYFINQLNLMIDYLNLKTVRGSEKMS